jgi:hypothetical protein
MPSAAVYSRGAGACNAHALRTAESVADMFSCQVCSAGCCWCCDAEDLSTCCNQPRVPPLLACTDRHAPAGYGSHPATSGAAACASAGGSPASSQPGSASDRMMYVTQSVAPPATRHLSGPCLDPNWEFDRGKSVRVLLQVRVVGHGCECLECFAVAAGVRVVYLLHCNGSSSRLPGARFLGQPLLLASLSFQR